MRDSTNDGSSESENEPDDQDKSVADGETTKPETPKATEPAPFNFMTEIFHITLRAMNIGYFAATTHYEKLHR